MARVRDRSAEQGKVKQERSQIRSVSTSILSRRSKNLRPPIKHGRRFSWQSSMTVQMHAFCWELHAKHRCRRDATLDARRCGHWSRGGASEENALVYAPAFDAPSRACWEARPSSRCITKLIDTTIGHACHLHAFRPRHIVTVRDCASQGTEPIVDPPHVPPTSKIRASTPSFGSAQSALKHLNKGPRRSRIPNSTCYTLPSLC